MNQRLPIRSDGALSRAYSLSLLVAVLSAAAVLGGLLFPAAVYPTADLRQSSVSTDVVNLFIGLPILLGSAALARRGRLIGLLFWPGALFFVTYHYIAYTVALPFTWQFVVYLALVCLSLYAMIGLLLAVDAEAVRERLRGAVPERFAGGTLVAFGALFFVLVLGILTGQPSAVETATAVADLVVIPAWVIGGVLLWQRRAIGYVAGTGLLFQASMLFVALLIFFVVQPFAAGVAFRTEDFTVIAVMGLICFVPFGLFVRGVLSRADETAAG